MDNLTKIKLKKHFQKEKAKKFWCELIEVALLLISIAVCITIMYFFASFEVVNYLMG